MRRIVSMKAALALPILLAMLLLLLAAACGGDSTNDEGAGKPEAKSEEQGDEGELFVDPNAPVIDVSLKEWGVAPAKAAAEAGEITFAVNNSGTTEHEFVVLKTNTPADKLMAVQAAEVDEDTAGASQGEIEDIAPGQTVSKTFDLAPGHYVFICNIEGHYQFGMHANFTVE